MPADPASIRRGGGGLPSRRPRRSGRAAPRRAAPDAARPTSLGGIDATIGAGPSRSGIGPLRRGARPDRVPAPSPTSGARVKIIVGLGNPGEQYAKTRHNIGWMVLDRIAERAGWSGKGRTRDASAIALGRFRGLDLVLAKPLTWMNDSGVAVRKLLAREHAPLADLLVVVDDFALPFGKLRLRERGGPGGHNGLRSIIDELSNEGFSRLRVGIGPPDRGFIDHVLAPFQPDERQRLDALLDAAADAVEEWARHGTSKAANRFNMFELRPADGALSAPPGEVDGPADASGVRRTRTGWRKALQHGDDG